MPADRFVVDAVDISANALARAGNAIYGKNSFRGKHLEFRDKYFVQGEDGYALSPDVQRHVTFHWDNLLREGFKPSVRYDFIFCRNLLIYFDRITQGAVLTKLRTMLAADRVLFVGPAEMPIVTECGFANANISHAFASRIMEVTGQKSEVRSPKSDLRLPTSDL